MTRSTEAYHWNQFVIGMTKGKGVVYQAGELVSEDPLTGQPVSW